MRYHVNTVYLTAHLREKLENIKRYPLTIITAPTGYGKTTVVREYCKRSKLPFAWLNNYTNNINDYWCGVCDMLGRIDTHVRDRLILMGLPGNFAERREFIRIVADIICLRECYVVVDDYHYIAAMPGIPELLQVVVQEFRDKLHFIILTRERIPHTTSLLSHGYAYQLTADDLTLCPGDIVQYFNRCGLSITTRQAKQLYTNSQGWFVVLYLYILSYIHYGSISEIECHEQIAELIETEVLNWLDSKSMDLLVSLCVVDQFSLGQAVFFNAKSSCILYMLKNKNAFITYEPNTDTYRFHPLLRQCLQNRFSKLPTDRQCKIYSVHSAWYYRVMDYYQAAIFAYKSQDYQAMLTAIAKLQAEHLTSSQKMTLLQQFLVCPRQISRINPHAEIIIAQIAIKQDRPCIYKPLLAELPADIASAPHLVRDEKYSLYCLLELLLGSMPDSEDIDEHLIHFIKAYQWYIESHYTKPEPIPEGGDCLSVLFQVLHDNTLLNEISDSIKKIYSFYDNIIIGKQSGRIDLYEAEVRFYQCDLTEAQIAIDKCIAKALQNQDWMLYLRAQFISTRLCCMKGLPLVCTTIREALASNGNKHLIYMWDVIEGFSYGLHGCPDHAASWLIHENTGNLDMYESLTPIAYIVHCILLFAHHEYIQLIATAEHFLEDRHFNESCLYCLYLKILLASANHAIGRSLVGKDLLRSALQIAISNQLYMPFVELGAAVMPLLDGLNTNGIPEQAITTIRQVYLTIQTSKHESLNKSQPGRMDVLTRREHQIASHVSSGMTNRQIAKQLYITENTVKSALKSIFGKLNISRREELAILVHTNFDTAL